MVVFLPSVYQKPDNFVIRPRVPTAHPARGDAKPTDQ